jgi:hypothetical protein
MGRSMKLSRGAAGSLGLVLASAAFGFVIGTPVPVAAQEAPAPSEGAPATEPATCTKVEFESAVDHAAESLRDLNNKNRPAFQARLRQLKEKRGWNDSQFLKEAEPFVKDDQIGVFDSKTNELLASISSLGQEGANAPEPNCTMLTELRGKMQVLIETQTAKWTYMFQKLDTELAK